MMMLANKELDSVARLSTELGTLESEIAGVRWQLRSFYGEGDADDPVLAIPVDFHPDNARRYLDDLLVKRHAAYAKLKSAEADYEQARAAEVEKLRADYLRQYRSAIKKMFESGVEFAKALADMDGVRDAAFQNFGQYTSPLPHVGPQTYTWRLNAWDCVIAHWARECLALKLLTGKESFLGDLKL